MLQQTQVQTVIPYWERWMGRFPDIQALARAPLSTVLKFWEGLGYYSRARNLHRAAQVITDRDGGQIPRDFNAWLALPGIGRYTAGAICSIAFNQPTPILDGNAARVLARWFALAQPIKSSPAQKQLWSWAAQLIETASRLKSEPEPRCSHFNQALMELGALICLPRQPLCPACPINRHCLAFQQETQDQIPVVSPGPAASQRNLIGVVVQRKDRFLVRQRPEQGVNAGLWEFPNIEVESWKETEAILNQLTGETLQGVRSWATLRFTITRFRMALHLYRAKLAAPPEADEPEGMVKEADWKMEDKRKLQTRGPSSLGLEHRTGAPREAGEGSANSGKWLTLKEIDALPLSAAHRRIARLLAKETVPAKNERNGRS